MVSTSHNAISSGDRNVLVIGVFVGRNHHTAITENDVHEPGLLALLCASVMLLLQSATVCTASSVQGVNELCMICDPQ